MSVQAFLKIARVHLPVAMRPGGFRPSKQPSVVVPLLPAARPRLGSAALRGEEHLAGRYEGSTTSKAYQKTKHNVSQRICVFRALLRQSCFTTPRMTSSHTAFASNSGMSRMIPREGATRACRRRSWPACQKDHIKDQKMAHAKHYRDELGRDAQQESRSIRQRS